MKKGGWIYITTNATKTVLYTGVTSNLHERILEHKTKKHPNSFTARYNVYYLVYYRWFPSIAEAIKEEKRIKGGSERKKRILINSMNPEWRDLWPSLQGAQQ